MDREVHGEARWRAHPEIFWGELAPCEHAVQMYEDEGALLDCLIGFVSSGLKRGEGVIVIATNAHLRAVESRLGDVDLVAAQRENRYLPLDAREALSNFMVGDWPDEGLFYRFIGGVLRKARGTSTRKVRAFGEMVALLWAQGHNGATVRLEHLWTELCQGSDLCLFCAYPRAGFTKNADVSIREICAAHSKIVAA
ncbi:MAG TPA: MEDS domain-containing protein [Verrucomicrobiae bacterium]